jgi:hypothetical protein
VYVAPHSLLSANQVKAKNLNNLELKVERGRAFNQCDYKM